MNVRIAGRHPPERLIGQSARSPTPNQDRTAEANRLESDIPPEPTLLVVWSDVRRLKPSTSVGQLLPAPNDASTATGNPMLSPRTSGRDPGF